MGISFSHFFRPHNQIQALNIDDHRSSDQEQHVDTLSKNAKKKIARELRLQERKRKRKENRRALKARKKIEKREEREEFLNCLPTEERARIICDRLESIRAERAVERGKRSHVRNVLENGTKYNICIDLGWNEQMFDKERKSLARQLSYSYSALRKAVEEGLTPMRLSIAGVDNTIKPFMSLAAQGWESWPLIVSEKSIDQLYDLEKLVYLTHDADDVLDTLDPSLIYVIGGVVDRNRLKGATKQKAESLGIRMARFNIDSIVSIEHGTPVLTVNHCVEILLQNANNKSWKDAYLNVLPQRKGISTCEEI